MPWLIFFLYSWIIFLIFIDTSRLRRTVYGGLIAFLLGTAVDWTGHMLHLYQFHSNLINKIDISFLYAAGPLFTMGTLFFQYISLDRGKQAVNIAAFTAAYFSSEFLLVSSGAASYMHWHYLASLAVDILVFTAFSYIGEIIVFGNAGGLNKTKRGDI